MVMALFLVGVPHKTANSMRVDTAVTQATTGCETWNVLSIHSFNNIVYELIHFFSKGVDNLKYYNYIERTI